MAKWVKALAIQHEDLSLKYENPYKNWADSINVSNSCTPMGRWEAKKGKF